MKKSIITVLISIMIFTAAFTAVNFAAVSAKAQPTKEGEETSLFVPSSYEQYLELNSPSDIALSKDYFAISDSNKIHIYNRATKTYSTAVLDEGTTVSSLNFYGENLYFVAKSSTKSPIAYIPCNNPSAPITETEIGTCASFLINGENVYYSSVATNDIKIYKTKMDGNDILSTSEKLDESDGNTVPAFSNDGDTVYYSIDNNIINVSASGVSTPPLPSSVSTFFASEGICYYADAATSKLYKYGNDDPLHLNNAEVKNVKSIRRYNDGENDLLYIVAGKSILTYSLTLNEFTDYEIGKSGASDISVYNQTIVIADKEKKSATIRGDKTATFPLIDKETPVTPQFICAGKDNFLIATNDSIYLSEYKEKSLKKITNVLGAPIAAVYSFGSYFIISDTGAAQTTYRIDESGNVTGSGSVSLTPKDLAADLYGNLFILDENGNVCELTQDEFLTDQSTGKIADSFDSTAQKLLIDWTGDLYVLTNVGIIRGKDDKKITIAPQEFVYTETDIEKPVLDFAFGFENDTVFILSDGFIIQTKSAEISCLKNLSAEGVYEDMLYTPLTETSANDLKIVSLTKGSLVIRLDMESAGTQKLPYQNYEKTVSEKTGIVLTDCQYGLIAAFCSETGYEYFLIPNKTQSSLIDTAEYLKDSSFDTGYTSNTVGLYRYPMMLSDLPLYRTPLVKGKTVKVLSLLSHDSLDTDYLFVSIENDSQTVYGFIPASYILEGSASEDTSLGSWRYARLDKGESVTLTLKEPSDDGSTTLTLKNKETLKIYDNKKDESGKVWAEYVKDGKVVAEGYISTSKLYNANPSVIVVVVVVSIVTAMVLVSICYLLLRKQPTVG